MKKILLGIFLILGTTIFGEIRGFDPYIIGVAKAEKGSLTCRIKMDPESEMARNVWESEIPYETYIFDSEDCNALVVTRPVAEQIMSGLMRSKGARFSKEGEVLVRVYTKYYRLSSNNNIKNLNMFYINSSSMSSNKGENKMIIDIKVN